MKESKDGRVAKLLRKIEDQKKEIRRLKKELVGHERAMNSSKEFLRGTSEAVQMDKLIKGAKKGKSLKEVKNEVAEEVCQKCLGTDFKRIGTRFGSLTICNGCNSQEKVMK